MDTAQPTSRFRAAISAWSFDRAIRRAAKRERKFLTDAGEALCAGCVSGGDEAAQALRAKIDALAAQLGAGDAAQRSSLDRDRTDFARASQLMKWVVVWRGLFERWVMRDQAKYQRRERAHLALGLGRLAFDGSHEALCATVPEGIRASVLRARSEIETARAAREQCLAPWHGEPLPRPLAVAVRETGSFLAHLWDQIAKKLFLRGPAIAALLVTWWLVHTYTSDYFEHLGRMFGFRSRRYMSPEEMARLQFWAPILAAAVIAYLTNVIAALVQRRYAPPRPPAG